MDIYNEWREVLKNLLLSEDQLILTESLGEGVYIYDYCCLHNALVYARGAWGLGSAYTEMNVKYCSSTISTHVGLGVCCQDVTLLRCYYALVLVSLDGCIMCH